MIVEEACKGEKVKQWNAFEEEKNLFNRLSQSSMNLAITQ